MLIAKEATEEVTLVLLTIEQGQQLMFIQTQIES